MKKFILVFAAVALSAGSAFAFGAREHSAVAMIAEKYLSPKARAAINEITGGQKIVMYASHPDKMRPIYLYNGKTLSHTCYFDENLNPNTGFEKSQFGAIELASKQLKDYKHSAAPDSCVLYLAYIVHFIGDMHCPSHIHYAKDAVKKSPKTYIIKGKDIKLKFHKAWDSGFEEFAFNGGPMDLAFMADIASKQQRKEYQKGELLDWAIDNARNCLDFTRDVEFNEDGVAYVDNAYAQQHAEYAKNQIMKAGYRLAETLNRIFK